jgi:hypothetical protein
MRLVSSVEDVISEATCRLLVAERSYGFCEVRIEDPGVCTGMGQSMHHRRKEGQGGPWRPSNIVHACGDGTRGCHGWIEANPATSAKRGLWLRAGMRPAESPVVLSFRGTRGVYLIDDTGSVTWLSRRGLELAQR